MNSVQSQVDPFQPQFIAALADFIKWASKYGHEIRQASKPLEDGVAKASYSVMLELSACLSASFNPGYDDSEQAMFLAVEADEFVWLPKLPIDEVVIGRQQVYILTKQVTLEGEDLDPMIIAVQVGQSGAWQMNPKATAIGFMCIESSNTDYEVAEYADERFPLRVLND